MKQMLQILIILFILAPLAMGQFQVKNESGTVIMKVTNEGNVGIGLGSATPASNLDISGTIRFRSLVKGTLTYPVLTVDNNGNLSVVEDKQGSGADGVVTGVSVDGGANKTLALTRSNSLPQVSATWTDMVDDADHVIGNEYPTAGSGIAVTGRQVSVKVDNSTIKFNGSGQLYADVSMTESDPIWTGEKSNYYTKTNLNTSGTINASTNPVQWTRLKGVPSGFADGTDHVNDADYVIGNEYPQSGIATSVSTRTVNVRVDNSSIKINGSNQLYALPGLEMYAHTNTPRNILITFSGNSITGVYYKDGAPTGVTNPAGNGWSTASSATYQQVTPSDGSRTGLGIKITPELAKISNDASIKALQVRAGAFAETGDNSALFFLGHSSSPLMKQMGDSSSGEALEANGFVILNNNQEFYLISQQQSDETRRLMYLWVTIFGGLR